MINIQYGHHVLYLGQTGSGKTVGMQWLYSQFPRTVVYDIEDYDHWEHIHNKTIVTHNPENLAKLLQVVMTENTPEIHIVYKPKENLIGDNLINDFDTICKIIYQCQNIAIFCDELGNATGLRPMDSEAPPYFVQLLTRGRKRGISFIGASQRNQNIPKIITAQARHKCIYRLDAYDCKAYAGYISNIGQILKLPPFHWSYQSDGNSELMKPVPQVVNISKEVIFYD